LSATTQSVQEECLTLGALSTTTPWKSISFFERRSTTKGSKEESEREEFHLAKDLTNRESDVKSVCSKRYWGERTYQQLRQGVGADPQL
jgi:hypothetical protein